MTSDTHPGPPPPTNRPHQAAEDVEAHFATTTAKMTVDSALKAAFIRSKLRVAYTHLNMDIASRDRAVKSLIDQLGADAHHAFSQMTAGETKATTGAFGAFYTDAFKSAWGHGTSLAYDIVCPTRAGGNVDDFLYLTATNRSALGVEAFVSYYKQNDLHFQVFDWSRPKDEHWQTNKSFSQLADYLKTESAHGRSYQVLPVTNSTFRLQGSTYRNQVMLYNRVRGGWDIVYHHDYTATDAQQKAVWVGSWGPIVETCQSRYNHTNKMGALTIQLNAADNHDKWGGWALLGATNARIRTDPVGFHLDLDPNYAFTVSS
jgi:hypothetical protein